MIIIWNGNHPVTTKEEQLSPRWDASVPVAERGLPPPMILSRRRTIRRRTIRRRRVPITTARAGGDRRVRRSRVAWHRRRERACSAGRGNREVWRWEAAGRRGHVACAGAWRHVGHWRWREASLGWGAEVAVGWEWRWEGEAVGAGGCGSLHVSCLISCMVAVSWVRLDLRGGMPGAPGAPGGGIPNGGGGI